MPAWEDGPRRKARRMDEDGQGRGQEQGKAAPGRHHGDGSADPRAHRNRHAHRRNGPAGTPAFGALAGSGPIV
ncbi:hypothetical protein ASG25_17515 [Rhizobium sp. Leaf384]|nr:hypothetical protein ASG03_09480 [Rhizobium sp. Leaf341]KQS77162.1 hypothetical protein ASG25_17515 [Rhizobium sp. Leaf384]KQS84856.1 hypothetical protein ASG58_20405 [Rhizobium sp. Leaf383]